MRHSVYVLSPRITIFPESDLYWGRPFWLLWSFNPVDENIFADILTEVNVLLNTGLITC
ncbi:Bgt-20676 [Blumeria graminis f. sp. tritici]|uniref:Bgt-20676 n=2 Tax=Blumeria graminis f. sp. tritici TaxID=62690 RepID=A0A381LFN3_BLUGR|nr:Bgt-20676 [Blumeria graminis f. sp. tritici]